MQVQRAQSSSTALFQGQFSHVLVKTLRLSYLPIASSTAHGYVLSFRRPNAEMNLIKYQLPPVSQLDGYSLFIAQRVKYMPKIPTNPWICLEGSAETAADLKSCRVIFLPGKSLVCYVHVVLSHKVEPGLSTSPVREDLRPSG